MNFFSSDAYEFWRDPVRGVLLAGAMCSFLGVYIVLRRVVFVGAALTQVAGVGIAFAFWLASFAGGPHPAPGHGHWWLNPQLYSLGFAVIGAALFSLNRGGKRVASETVVGLGWVIAAALLLLILSSKRIVQEAHEVDDLLYGTAVLILPAEVKVLAIVAASVLAVHLLFFKELLFVSYDSEMAQTLGYKTGLWDLLLFATFGIGISFAVRAVGALPAFGFVVIPAASAQLLVKRAVWMFPLAVLFSIFGGFFGYYYAFTKGYPTGAAIVAVLAVTLVPGLLWQAALRWLGVEQLLARRKRGK